MCETGRTARRASAWAAAAVNEGKNDTNRAFFNARATTYLVIMSITAWGMSLVRVQIRRSFRRRNGPNLTSLETFVHV